MKRVCVFTSTRADFGLLRRLMEAVRDHDQLELQILATGSHLSKAHGHTVDEITAAGLNPDACVALPLEDDSALGICRAMGAAVSSVGEALSEMKPDLFAILGDRWEALAAACAATVLRIPVAHLYGGETTLGAMDESFRHAITKMAHLHLTASEVYRNRVVQMGEEPDRVLNVGAIAIENIRSLKLLDRDPLSEDLGLDLSGPYILCTFHPATLDPGQGEAQMREFLAALDEFPDLPVILTLGGADTEGQAINQMARDWATERPSRARAFRSLGQLRYLSAMNHASVVAGNSSSGIIEGPTMRVPTVNVGQRQEGRLRAQSIIDCPPERNAIVAALHQALSPEFSATARASRNPLERSGTVQAIVRAMAAFDGDVKKPFHDLSGKD